VHIEHILSFSAAASASAAAAAVVAPAVALGVSECVEQALLNHEALLEGAWPKVWVWVWVCWSAHPTPLSPVRTGVKRLLQVISETFAKLRQFGGSTPHFVSRALRRMVLTRLCDAVWLGLTDVLLTSVFEAMRVCPAHITITTPHQIVPGTHCRPLRSSLARAPQSGIKCLCARVRACFR
jgi:hypothetical protein